MAVFMGKKLKAHFILLVIALIANVVSIAYALEMDANSVKQAVQSKKASWTAGETSVSKLEADYRKNLLGLIKPDANETASLSVATEDSLSTSAASLPTSLDWRSYNGGDYVTPIRDQGNCGSCWAFATTAALESQVLMNKDTADANLDLAEQTLVSCSGAGDCSGGYINKASDYLNDVGEPLEDCFPYEDSNGTCANACSDWQSSTYTISGYHWVATDSPTVSALKNALYQYGPLVTTMDVYSDFYYYIKGIYTQTSGSYEGAHAVLIIGYDDDDECFIVKNSWGTGWGESGFFRIAYSELSSSVTFGEYTIAYEGNTSPDNDDSDDDQTCNYTLSGTSAFYRSYGGRGTVDVSTDDACSWEATSSVFWITVSRGNSGDGTQPVGFNVAANTGRETRTGTMTIAGKTFIVTQSGRSFWRR